MPPPKHPDWQYFTVINARTSPESKKPIVQCRLCKLKIKYATLQKLHSHIPLCPMKIPIENEETSIPSCPVASTSKSTAIFFPPVVNLPKVNIDEATLSKAIKDVLNGGKLSHVSSEYNIPVSFLFLQITRLKLKEKSLDKKKESKRGSAISKKSRSHPRDADGLYHGFYEAVVVSDKVHSKKIFIRDRNTLVISKDLYKATQKCRKDGSTLASVARKYNVPYKSLWGYLKRLKKQNDSSFENSKVLPRNNSSKKKKISNSNSSSGSSTTLDLVLSSKIPPVSQAINKSISSCSSTNDSSINAEQQIAAPSSDKRGLPVDCSKFSYFSIIKKLKAQHLLHISSSMLNALYDVDKGTDYDIAAHAHNVDAKVLSTFCSKIREFSAAQEKKRSNLNSNMKILIMKYSNQQVEEMKNFASNLVMVAFTRKVQRSYTPSALVSAVLSIAQGKSNLTVTSQQYCIPYASLVAAITQLGLYVPQRNFKARKKIDNHKNKSEKESEPETLDNPESSSPQMSIEPVPQSIVKHGESDSNDSAVCHFCHQPGHREIEIGKLHTLEDISTHYYCLLFSSGLDQKGEDEEGILGFLLQDIKKELRRGQKLRCVYCGLNGATIGCNNRQCRKTYHFPCGLDKFVQYIFCDDFPTYCQDHRNFQSCSQVGKEIECPICMENMMVNPKYCVRSPCCKRSSWFHKICLQKLAISAGYFFKCPLCNDKKKFNNEMLKQGIFVPERDASWELEPNAFEELLERPRMCKANKCLCPKGRKGDADKGKWELIFCIICGSVAIHSACRRESKSKPEWTCIHCRELMKGIKVPNSTTHNKSIKRLLSPDSNTGNCEKRIKLSEETPIAPSSSLSSLSTGNPSGLFPYSLSGYILNMKPDPSISPSNIISNIKSTRKSPTSVQDMFRLARNIFFDLEKRKITCERIHSICLKFTCYKVFVKEDLFMHFSRCSLRYDQMFFLHKFFLFIFFFKNARKKKKNTPVKVLVPEFCKHLKDGLPNSEDLQDCFRISDPKSDSSEGKTKLLSEDLLSEIDNEEKIEELGTSQPVNSLKSSIDKCKLILRQPTLDIQSENMSFMSRFDRVAHLTEVSETCSWCQKYLIPGISPLTVNIATGTVMIMCTHCKTYNIMEEILKDAIIDGKAAYEINQHVSNQEIDDPDSSQICISLDSRSCSPKPDNNEDDKINQNKNHGRWSVSTELQGTSTKDSMQVKMPSNEDTALLRNFEHAEPSPILLSQIVNTEMDDQATIPCNTSSIAIDISSNERTTSCESIIQLPLALPQRICTEVNHHSLSKPITDGRSTLSKEIHDRCLELDQGISLLDNNPQLASPPVPKKGQSMTQENSAVLLQDSCIKHTSMLINDSTTLRAKNKARPVLILPKPQTELDVDTPKDSTTACDKDKASAVPILRKPQTDLNINALPLNYSCIKHTSTFNSPVEAALSCRTSSCFALNSSQIDKSAPSFNRSQSSQVSIRSLNENLISVGTHLQSNSGELKDIVQSTKMNDQLIKACPKPFSTASENLPKTASYIFNCSNANSEIESLIISPVNKNLLGTPPTYAVATKSPALLHLNEITTEELIPTLNHSKVLPPTDTNMNTKGIENMKVPLATLKSNQPLTDSLHISNNQTLLLNKLPVPSSKISFPVEFPNTDCLSNSSNDLKEPNKNHICASSSENSMINNKDNGNLVALPPKVANYPLAIARNPSPPVTSVLSNKLNSCVTMATSVTQLISTPTVSVKCKSHILSSTNEEIGNPPSVTHHPHQHKSIPSEDKSPSTNDDVTLLPSSHRYGKTYVAKPKLCSSSSSFDSYLPETVTVNIKKGVERYDDKISITSLPHQDIVTLQLCPTKTASDSSFKTCEESLSKKTIQEAKKPSLSDLSPQKSTSVFSKIDLDSSPKPESVSISYTNLPGFSKTILSSDIGQPEQATESSQVEDNLAREKTLYCEGLIARIASSKIIDPKVPLDTSELYLLEDKRIELNGTPSQSSSSNVPDHTVSKDSTYQNCRLTKSLEEEGILTENVVSLPEAQLKNPIHNTPFPNLNKAFNFLRKIASKRVERHALISQFLFNGTTSDCAICSMLGQSSSFKSSTYYFTCSGCPEKPSLCNKEHFFIWHTINHVPIVFSKASSKPFDSTTFCTVCLEITNVKFYCIACPGIFGFCSEKHFYYFHEENHSLLYLKNKELLEKITSQEFKAVQGSPSNYLYKMLSFSKDGLDKKLDSILPLHSDQPIKERLQAHIENLKKVNDICESSPKTSKDCTVPHLSNEIEEKASKAGFPADRVEVEAFEELPKPQNGPNVKKGEYISGNLSRNASSEASDPLALQRSNISLTNILRKTRMKSQASLYKEQSIKCVSYSTPSLSKVPAQETRTSQSLSNNSGFCEILQSQRDDASIHSDTEKLQISLTKMLRKERRVEPLKRDSESGNLPAEGANNSQCSSSSDCKGNSAESELSCIPNKSASDHPADQINLASKNETPPSQAIQTDVPPPSSQTFKASSSNQQAIIQLEQSTSVQQPKNLCLPLIVDIINEIETVDTVCTIISVEGNYKNYYQAK